MPIYNPRVLLNCIGNRRPACGSSLTNHAGVGGNCQPSKVRHENEGINEKQVDILI